MLDSKLTRIKELIELKEKTDTELAQLLGEAEKPKRGRPRGTIAEVQTEESTDGKGEEPAGR